MLFLQMFVCGWLELCLWIECFVVVQVQLIFDDMVQCLNLCDKYDYEFYFYEQQCDVDYVCDQCVLECVDLLFEVIGVWCVGYVVVFYVVDDDCDDVCDVICQLVNCIEVVQYVGQCVQFVQVFGICGFWYCWCWKLV